MGTQLYEMAKLLPEDTGLEVTVFIDPCKRITGHSSVRIKVQNLNDPKSTNWPSIAMVDPIKKKFKITGDVSKIPAKTLETVKIWFIQNYAYLKKCL